MILWRTVCGSRFRPVRVLTKMSRSIFTSLALPSFRVTALPKPAAPQPRPMKPTMSSVLLVKPMKAPRSSSIEPDKNGVGEVLIRGRDGFQRILQKSESDQRSIHRRRLVSQRRSRANSTMTDILYIVGRAKDVIVLPSGKNVHPEDLEAHYLKSPLVDELAVIGFADDDAEAGRRKACCRRRSRFRIPPSRAKIANSKEAIRHDLDNLGRELAGISAGPRLHHPDRSASAYSDSKDQTISN